MQAERSSLLPASAIDALGIIGAKLERQELIGPELDAALDGLGGLSAGDVIAVEREIANLAQLSRWRPAQPRIVSLFGRKVSDLEQLVRVPGTELLFLFHRDGFLREAALRKIEGGLPNPFAFGAVACRLNDWAEPVRQAAVECAARTFPLTDATVVAKAALTLLARQSSWARWTTERVVLAKVFERPAVANELAEIIMASATGPVTAVLRVSMRGAALDPHLDALSERAIQPSVRALAAEAVIAGRARWPAGLQWKWIDKSMGLRRRVMSFDERPLSLVDDPMPAIVRSLRDRSAVVRRVGLDGLIRQRDMIANTRALAEPLLHDRSPSVRERAEFLMRVDR